MIKIKIYSAKFSYITTLFDTEIDGVSYRKVLGEIGDMQFTVRLDSDKVTDETIRAYNRIELVDDGEVVFVGYIVRKTVGFSTVSIRCKELAGILKKRLCADPFTPNGLAGDKITELFDAMNADDDTGISIGRIEAGVTINSTFNRETIWSVLTKLAQLTGCQFYVGNDRKLYFVNQVGEDRSATIIFRYKASQIQTANILEFSVDDDGDDIWNKVFGKSDALTTTQEDLTLQLQYGLLETFQNFRTSNVQDDLDAIALAQIADHNYSPALKLGAVGEFDVGDLIKVEINNKIVNIDDTFQITEKVVSYQTKEKQV